MTSTCVGLWRAGALLCGSRGVFVIYTTSKMMYTDSMDYILPWLVVLGSGIMNVLQFATHKRQTEAMIEKTLAESLESGGAASKAISEATVSTVSYLREQIEEMKSDSGVYKDQIQEMKSDSGVYKDQIQEMKSNSGTYFKRVEILENYIKVLTTEVKELREENEDLRGGLKERDQVIIRYQQNGKAGIL